MRRLGSRLAPLAAVAVIAVLLPWSALSSAGAAEETQTYRGTAAIDCGTAYGSEVPRTYTLGVEVALPTTVTRGAEIAARPAIYTLDLGDYWEEVGEESGNPLTTPISYRISTGWIGVASGSGQTSQSSFTTDTSDAQVVTGADADTTFTFASEFPSFGVAGNAEDTLRVSVETLTLTRGEDNLACEPTADNDLFTLSVVGASSEDVPDTTLSADLTYACQLNADGVSVTLPITATVTLPERIAPGSRVAADFQFVATLPSTLTAAIAAFENDGEKYTTFAGYSDNLEANVVVGNRDATAWRLPRVRASGTLPASGAFTTTTEPGSVRIDVPADAQDGEQITIYGPSADQVDHPRTDIGGTIAFTMAAALYRPNSTQALTANIVCKSPLRTPKIGAVTVDTSVAVVIDDPTEYVNYASTPGATVGDDTVNAGTADFTASGSTTATSAGGLGGLSAAPGLTAPSTTAITTATQPVAFGTTSPPSSSVLSRTSLLWPLLLTAAGVLTVLSYHRRSLRRDRY